MDSPIKAQLDLSQEESLFPAQSPSLGQSERMASMPEKHHTLPTEREIEDDNVPKSRSVDRCPTELLDMIIVPVIKNLGVCRGHFDLDNRGVRIEEYCMEVPKVLKMFGSSKSMASAALDIFTQFHTLRIEAEKLRYTRFSTTPTGPMLIGKEALPFNREKLESLTILLNGGSLSVSNTQAFADLTNSIENIPKCFTKLRTLTIDIEWDIDEFNERWAPLYAFLLEQGQVRASDLPLANIRGAHKKCENYFKLVRELHYFHRNSDCDVRILSRGQEAWFAGDWGYDLIVAGWLFPNSYAWRINGFQDWVRDYTMTHVGPPGQDVVVGIEVLHRESDDEKPSEEYGNDFTYATALTWAARYNALSAQAKVVLASEKAFREAQDVD